MFLRTVLELGKLFLHLEVVKLLLALSRVLPLFSPPLICPHLVGLLVLQPLLKFLLFRQLFHQELVQVRLLVLHDCALAIEHRVPSLLDLLLLSNPVSTIYRVRRWRPLLEGQFIGSCGFTIGAAHAQ